MQQRAVFLDRDGTIIEDEIYLNDVNKIRYLPHTFEALKLLQDLNYKLIVVTNQSGLARGFVEIDKLKAIHKKIYQDGAKRGVEIVGFYYAPFMPITNHYLRKPNPGMLGEAQFHFHIDMKNSWMIGDRMTDVEAGHRAQTQSILIGNWESPQHPQFISPEAHVDNLLEAAQFIAKFEGGTFKEEEKV